MKPEHCFYIGLLAGAVVAGLLGWGAWCAAHGDWIGFLFTMPPGLILACWFTLLVEQLRWGQNDQA